MKLFPRPEEAYKSGALLHRMRARRFCWFNDAAMALGTPLRIIDIGGTNSFWADHNWAGRSDVHITTINVNAEPKLYSNIEPLRGDATNLSQFPDYGFDIAFSNSVIEHLFTFTNQVAMAREIRRVAKAYWVQTPNFWFPVEPHFQFLGWHWMPQFMRVAIIRRRACGWRGQCPEPGEARRIVEEVRLLTRQELRLLFPEAKIMPERFCGLTKSWIALNGFVRH